MPFDIGESINSVADALLRAPIINKIATNPIYTALSVVFVVMLIILVVFRDADTSEPLLTLCLRSGFWTFLLLTGVLFLQNKVLTRESDSQGKNTAYENVFNGPYGGTGESPAGAPSAALEDYIVPVSINTNFT
jgi:hypothetical protein